MYKPSIRICVYKGWLVLTLLQNGPKLRKVAAGTIIQSFFAKDVEMSPEAGVFLSDKLLNKKEEGAGIEFMSKSSIFWAMSEKGIIIPPSEPINVYQLPLHTVCNNTIDPQLQTNIDKQQNLSNVTT